MDDVSPEVEIDERPQRRREWTGPFRNIALPLLVVAAIVAGVWYLQAGRSSGAVKGGGVIPLVASRNHTGQPPSAEQGRAAPDFRLTTLDGRTVRLSDLQGKTVLVNFWATWCQPCRDEIPNIVQAYGQYHDKGFEVVAVDEQENPGIVKQFADAYGMAFPVVLDSSGQVGQTYRAGNTFPTSVWLDPNGVVTDVHYGPMTPQYLNDKLSALQ
jgi:cytochrome c biogenesis protein CcmG/thiol:disulfide interchange protein DsbE